MKLMNFIIVNDDTSEIYNWLQSDTRNALKELKFVQASFPNRPYKLYKEVTGEDI